MKLVITADLHYNIARSVGPTEDLARRVCAIDADALLILGDVAGRDVGIVRDCLRLFDSFRGRKLFVAGNHDIWTDPGEDSIDKLERILPCVCRDAGFHALDIEPVILDGIGLVGSIGWYDYSFRAIELGIPRRFYEAKTAPGAADRLSGYDDLLADRGDIPDAAMGIGTRWMDGQYVRMAMDDDAFCDYLIDRLKRHLDQVATRCDSIIVGMHHLPFRELLPINTQPSWAFARAFLGSEAFGHVLLAEPKVRQLYTGHTHRAVRARCGHIDCADVGSTYVGKRYEIIYL